jgi:hypothetical protein
MFVIARKSGCLNLVGKLEGESLSTLPPRCCVTGIVTVKQEGRS